MAKKKKMRLCASVQKTFEEGFREFILDCKSRNLRQGTIIHYEVAIKQIYKRVPADTPISELSEKTMRFMDAETKRNTAGCHRRTYGSGDLYGSPDFVLHSLTRLAKIEHDADSE